jgi:hypothetical protein
MPDDRLIVTVGQEEVWTAFLLVLAQASVATLDPGSQRELADDIRRRALDPREPARQGLAPQQADDLGRLAALYRSLLVAFRDGQEL